MYGFNSKIDEQHASNLLMLAETKQKAFKNSNSVLHYLLQELITDLSKTTTFFPIREQAAPTILSTKPKKKQPKSFLKKTNKIEKKLD